MVVGDPDTPPTVTVEDDDKPRISESLRKNGQTIGSTVPLRWSPSELATSYNIR